MLHPVLGVDGIAADARAPIVVADHTEPTSGAAWRFPWGSKGPEPARGMARTAHEDELRANLSKKLAALRALRKNAGKRCKRAQKAAEGLRAKGDGARAASKLAEAKAAAREQEECQARAEALRQAMQAELSKARQCELLAARQASFKARVMASAQRLDQQGRSDDADTARALAAKLEGAKGLLPLAAEGFAQQGPATRNHAAAKAAADNVRGLLADSSRVIKQEARNAEAGLPPSCESPHWVAPGMTPPPELWRDGMRDPRDTELPPALRQDAWLLILPKADSAQRQREILRADANAGEDANARGPPGILIATDEHPIGVVVILGELHQPPLCVFVRDPTLAYLCVQDGHFSADAAAAGGSTGGDNRCLTKDDLSLDWLQRAGMLCARYANDQSRPRVVCSGVSWSHGPRVPLGGNAASGSAAEEEGLGRCSSGGARYECNALLASALDSSPDECKLFDSVLCGAAIVLGRLYSVLLPMAYAEYAALIRMCAAGVCDTVGGWHSRNPLELTGIHRLNVTGRGKGNVRTFGTGQHFDKDVRASPDNLGAAAHVPVSVGQVWHDNLNTRTAERPWEMAPATIRPLACWAPRGEFARKSYFRMSGFDVGWELTDTEVMVAWRGGARHGTDAGLVKFPDDPANDVWGTSTELSERAARKCLKRQHEEMRAAEAAWDRLA